MAYFSFCAMSECDAPAVFALADGGNTDEIDPDFSCALGRVAGLALHPNSPARLFDIPAGTLKALEAAVCELGTQLPLVTVISENEREFDHRFGIIRTASRNGAVMGLAHGLIAACRLFAAPNDDPTDGALCSEALRNMVQDFFPHGLPVVGAMPKGAVLAPTEYSVLARWRDGHILFLAISQGLIAQVDAAHAAALEGDLTTVEACLEKAATLFHGSAVALKHTGRMSRSEYEDIVRPTMQPPYVRDGFSGAYMAEHRHLMKRMRALKDALAGRPAALEPVRQRYESAVNVAYAAHRHCCELVTGERPSLSRARAGGDAPSGGESLVGFAARSLLAAGADVPNLTQKSKEPEMILTILETISLKPEFATPEGAALAGQAYDRAVGDNAHDADGHVAHASFFFDADASALIVLYPWFGRENITRLLESEGPLLEDWFQTYATGPRRARILDELPVVVTPEEEPA